MARPERSTRGRVAGCPLRDTKDSKSRQPKERWIDRYREKGRERDQRRGLGKWAMVVRNGRRLPMFSSARKEAKIVSWLA